jgi:hypothetical protein
MLYTSIICQFEVVSHLLYLEMGVESESVERQFEIIKLLKTACPSIYAVGLIRGIYNVPAIIRLGEPIEMQLRNGRGSGYHDLFSTYMARCV